MKRARQLLVYALVLGPVIALLVWWQLAEMHHPQFVKRWGTPSGIVQVLWGWCWDGSLWPHLWSTLGIAMAGLALGAVIGVLFAYLCHSFQLLGSVLTPFMTWANSLPRVLLVPIFIASLGIGLSAKLAMVVAMTAFVFFFNMLNGLASIDERIILNARLLGARGLQLVRHVHGPLTMAWLMASLRPALGFAVIGAVVSEYFGATSGLGYIVDIAYGSNRYDRAIAGLLAIFLSVGVLDLMLRRIERFSNSGGRPRRSTS